jgi:hypothetical protein
MLKHKIYEYIHQRLVLAFTKMMQWYCQILILGRKNDKIALCCIAKCENDYIEEFVNYYLKIGVDKVFVYDNNDVVGESIEDVLFKSIGEGHCSVVNYRGRKVCQLKAYQDCYDNHNKEYDWIIFCDVDEFLFLTESMSIKEFLGQKKFRGCHIVHINWKIYGDNDLLFYDNRNVTERFVNPICPNDFKQQFDVPENNHIKSIVRGGLADISWSITPHTPISKFYRCCNASGKKCDPNSPFAPFDFTFAYFRHYMTKTIDEWIRIKQKRGYPDQTNEDAERKLGIDVFFRINKWTKEKQEVVDKYLRR